MESEGPVEDALRRHRRWTQTLQRVGLGVLVSLAIVGPTFWLEETWHGAPLIDRGGLLGLLPSVVMAIDFFLGGTAAGYLRRAPRVALLHGFVVAVATIGLVFAWDLNRRHSLGEGLPPGVMAYWIEALGAAVLVGGIGAAFGRLSAIRSWKRRQNPAP